MQEKSKINYLRKYWIEIIIVIILAINTVLMSYVTANSNLPAKVSSFFVLLILAIIYALVDILFLVMTPSFKHLPSSEKISNIFNRFTQDLVSPLIMFALGWIVAN